MSTTSGGAETVNRGLRTIGVLFEPGDVIEIRALDVGRTQERTGNTFSGYFNFDNSAAITAAIQFTDGNAEGVYVVLNRIDPNLLARSNNRLRCRPKHTTGDASIIEWRWLYVDADATRPAGISSTDAEHDEALRRTLSIRQFLSERGWPDPIFCDSGNGGHLLYRLPLMEVRRAGELVKLCLQALSARYSDSSVKVDESTATAARLCKLYGTLACKGDPVPDRPHRRSSILESPERIEAVQMADLEALASEVPLAISPTNKNTFASDKFVIDKWLAESGLEIASGPGVYKGGRRWILRLCPFNSAHQKPALIEHASGGLAFTCLHNSCAENDWFALRRLIEPDYSKKTGPRHSDKLQSNPETASCDDAPLIKELSQLPSVWEIEAKLEWSVEDMIARGSITLLCAESGTGKTWFGYYLAGCVAHGHSLLGRRVHRSKVLYLDGENPLYLVKQRLWDLGVQQTPDLTIWGGWNVSPPLGPHSPLVIDFAREQKGLIIYDSLIEFHPGSEQSSTETRAFMRQFRTLANLGATVIILHHTGKTESAKLYRGSSDIKAAVDTAYLLSPVDQNPSHTLAKLSMTCFKGRLMPGQNFGLEFQAGQGFVSSGASQLGRTATCVIAEILRANPRSNQTTVVRLGQAGGYTRREIEGCLKTGNWEWTAGPKNSTLYSLPPDEGATNEAF